MYKHTHTHNELGARVCAAVKRLEQMRAQGSQCKAREDEEWRYSLIRGEMASPQVLRHMRALLRICADPNLSLHIPTCHNGLEVGADATPLPQGRQPQGLLSQQLAG